MATLHSQMLDSQIRRDEERKKEVIKLLILGSPGSGKTTVMKQLKVRFHETYTEHELNCKREYVYGNCVLNVLDVCDALRKSNERFAKSTNQAHERRLRQLMAQQDAGNLLDTISLTTFISLRSIWNDETVKRLREEGAAIDEMDRAEFFMDKLDMIALSGYIPTPQDAFRIREGHQLEQRFTLNGHDFRVIDVDQNERCRRKWLHIFDDVKAIIYVFALSEYDQILRNPVMNRLLRSLTLFRRICRRLPSTAMIVLMNKNDIFERKLQHRPFSSNNAKECADYIAKKFEDIQTSLKQPIFTHSICAVSNNADEVSCILASMKHIILQRNLVWASVE